MREMPIDVCIPDTYRISRFLSVENGAAGRVVMELLAR